MAANLAIATDCLAGDSTTTIRWEFASEESSPLRPHGGVHRDVPGPRPPTYPDFAVDNTAIQLDGDGAYYAIDDSGPESDFDFGDGDAITLEAWVQVDDLHRGENVYVIGKGRTGNDGFAVDNQNWALRVRETAGTASVSFLFATPRQPAAAGDQHWHRWTSTSGFTPGPHWHHIAVRYQFGDPYSIRGWIDGKPQPGRWDMGGPTSQPPVVDDDAVWIGSSRGGAAGNSFRGSLDEIAIHRRCLDDQTMASRYRRIGDDSDAAEVIGPALAAMPDLGDIIDDQVLLTLHKGMPAHDRWLLTNEALPETTLQLHSEAMLLDRLPQRFDDWGIRAAWDPPVLMRMATDVPLDAGTHRWLCRVRGLTRLWVDGQLIAEGQPLTGSPSGEEPMTPVAAPPLAGMRIAEHRQQELFAEWTLPEPKRCRVVLETLVGGKKFRTDPGEFLVALQRDGESNFTLVTAPNGPSISVTDGDITAALDRQEQSLTANDDGRRRAAAASQDDFWDDRHQWARQWVLQNPPPQPPDASLHPIDAFVQAKIQRAVEAASATTAQAAESFHQQVLPILSEHCFRCHGDKQQGGLRLDSRADALLAGDSELTAIVPGDPASSEMIRRIQTDDLGERMPPGDDGLRPEQIATLQQWIAGGAGWPPPPLDPDAVELTDPTDDAAFLRRLTLDTIGVPASETEVHEFLQDTSPNKRLAAIDRLLDHPRWADAQMGYWQDVLAENPTLINASLNTTGPFRWFLYDALRDAKPWDRVVTELILQRGSPHEGGSAGFGIAANNDSPAAAKGQILASAFLAIELQCARCHDSPYHSTTQSDLYALAAMLQRKSVTVPQSSRVPEAFFASKSRQSLIEVSLKPDAAVTPQWPFADVTGCGDGDDLASLMRDADDSRERLAALITAPQNQRFAQVMVNRVWRRLIGTGIVEPPDDWEGQTPSHPELLQWLAADFVSHDYDLKHLSRVILSSQLYGRQARSLDPGIAADQRYFAAPNRRRMTAEQVVDSLHAAAGQAMNVEELTFDPDGRRPANNRLTLGVPTAAWMFASLANERDRPSLGLPRARAISDILEAFGWSGSRQNPSTDRESAASVLQPGVMANSTASVWLTRATDGSGLAELAVQSESPTELIERLFMRYLNRLPTDAEREPLIAVIADGFDQRLVAAQRVQVPPPPPPLPAVTWSNHLRPESNEIALQLEQRARQGAAADPRLEPQWRERYEDVVWSLVNLAEFVWIP